MRNACLAAALRAAAHPRKPYRLESLRHDSIRSIWKATTSWERSVRSVIWYEIIWYLMSLCYYDIYIILYMISWCEQDCMPLRASAWWYSRPTPPIWSWWNRSTSRPISTCRGTAWRGIFFNCTFCVRQALRGTADDIDYDIIVWTMMS
jgi:hypothetical protein